MEQKALTMIKWESRLMKHLKMFTKLIVYNLI